MRIAMLLLLASLVPTAAVAADAPQTPPQAIGTHRCPDNPFLSGKATVVFDIGTDGAPANLKIGESTGGPEVDRDAIACVRDWRYAPVVVDGKPVVFPWKVKLTWYNPDEWVPVLTTRFSQLCDGVPVPAAKEEHSEKGTVMAFRVGIDGRVKNAFVIESSGNAAFDAMALQCTANWVYRPVEQNGRAAEIPWASTLRWNAQLASFFHSDGTHFNGGAICGDTWYPASARQAKIEGATLLSFTIRRGIAEDLTVTTSSGSAELDQAALACAKTWSYREPKFNDPQFREPWSARVIWKDGHAFVVQVPKPQPL